MTTNRRGLALRTALTYAVSAALWIVLSDGMLGWMDAQAERWSHLGTIKGLAFVFFTAAMLYLILARLLHKLEKAETAVRTQESRWRLALDGIGDGLWDWNLATGQVFFSPRLQAMLGYQPGEFQPALAEWESRLHPDDLATARAAREDHFRRTTAVYEHQQRIRTKGDEYRWFLDRGVVIEREPDGRPRRMIGTLSDIGVRIELEAQLQAQSERYRMLFEQNPHPMWIYESETRRILTVNDAAVKKYGYAREDFLKLTILDLYPPEDVPELLQKLAECSQPIAASGPWRHRLASGEIVFGEVLSHAITWEGRAARMVVVHDVTTQQRAVNGFEEIAQKFRAIFESANDAIFIADYCYRVVDCNQRALEIFQASRDEVVGHRVVEFFPPLQADGSDSIATARGVAAEAWAKRSAPMEWLLRRPNGTIFGSEITVSGFMHGKRRLIVAVARDTTERKRSMERLHLLQAALQATPAGIVITAADGLIEWVNPAFIQMTGYSLDEAIGHTPRIQRSGEHDGEFYRRMWTTIRAGEVWSGEIHNRRKDGSVYHEHMTIAPVRNQAGAITNFIAVKKDITHERRLELQLARSQRLESVGMLASGIAHDLNNVLTPIGLAVELLRSEGGISLVNRDRLDLVEQATKRGASIVRQVLTFARGVEGERTIVQPSYLIKEVAHLAEEAFPRSIELRVECGRDVPMVCGDVTQLHQVLLNLAVNARDAMPLGGRLTLGARAVVVGLERARALAPFAPGNYVELTVTDTGTGITDKVLEHMFEPFFTTKPRGKGTGLGLSTVYGIVRSHGGKVEVETKLGHGTTFRILLPEVVETPAPGVAKAAERGLEGGGQRVLVVDDEEAIRVIVEQTLRRHGFDPVLAGDGVQALQIFKLRPAAYHAAFVDLMMPRMRGTELIRELRALKPEMRIVYASGFSGGDDMADEMAELAADEANVFLPKPFTGEELLSALRKAEAAALTPRGKKKV